MDKVNGVCVFMMQKGDRISQKTAGSSFKV